MNPRRSLLVLLLASWPVVAAAEKPTGARGVGVARVREELGKVMRASFGERTPGFVQSSPHHFAQVIKRLARFAYIKAYPDSHALVVGEHPPAANDGTLWR